jgi:ferredoxin-NADP reductase
MTGIEALAPHGQKLEWRLAELRETMVETSRVKSLILHVPGWPRHVPGQHVDIRLTSGDGYQAERSYSISSSPEDPLLALTVEKVEDGEVSPYLVDDLPIGGQFELRGPIGGYFVWTVELGGPLCLIAGGSGVAPLMAMLRHRETSHNRPDAVLIYSSRTLDDVIYREELDKMARGDPGLVVINTLSREQPEGWLGRRGRIDRALLMEASFPPNECPKMFICGPTQFVENISQILVELGHDPMTIKTERFGPTGG